MQSMNSKRRQKLKLIGMCLAISLSIASYMTLHILESGNPGIDAQEMMAEEVEADHALPDVHLLKKLMHKTLEFMIIAPGLGS